MQIERNRRLGFDKCSVEDTITSFDQLRLSVISLPATNVSVVLTEAKDRLLLTPVGSGFPIDIMLDNQRLPILFLGYWFDDGELGYNGIFELVRHALNSDLRLRTKFSKTSRGEKPCAYEVERRCPDGTWATIAGLSFPTINIFWRKRTYTERLDQFPKLAPGG